MYNDEIIELLGCLSVRSNKAATSKQPMLLSDNQASALGVKKRNFLRFVKTAIQAISDKMEIQAIVLNDVQSNIVVEEWKKVAFDRLEKDIYKAVVRDGITYVLVAYDGNKPVLQQVDSFDGNVGAITVEDAITNTALYTVNLWYAKKQRNLDIYYPDRIEKYYYDLDTGEWEQRIDTPKESWPIAWVDNNNQPLGIALVAFDITESDITEAVQLQNDMNDALLDMLATSRNMGWPQRVLSNASQETYLLNQYEQPLLVDSVGYPIPRKIELTPASILMLQGKDSKLEQLPAADVNTAALDKLEKYMSEMTTVPTFYFSGGEFPSGVALIQSESKLCSKVESHQVYLTPSIQTMITLMLRLSNTFGNTAYNTDAIIEITWYPPETETEDLRLQKQDSLTKNLVLLSGAGLVSTDTAVRMLHPDWDESQVQAEVARLSVSNLQGL